jgi:hypothetical protein
MIEAAILNKLGIEGIRTLKIVQESKGTVNNFFYG